MIAPYTAAELAAILARASKAHTQPGEQYGIWEDPAVTRADVRRLVAELTRAREALREISVQGRIQKARAIARALLPDDAAGSAPGEGGE